MLSALRATRAVSSRRSSRAVLTLASRRYSTQPPPLEADTFSNLLNSLADRPAQEYEAAQNDDFDDDGPPTADPSLYPKQEFQRTANPVSEAFEREHHAPLYIQYHLNVRSTRNNVMVVLTNERGEPVKNGWWTGGSVGFKGKNEAGYEAGYQCCVRAFKRMEEVLEELPAVRFELRLKGSGQGREAVVRSIMTSEGDQIRGMVNRVTDTTPIKIGGTRSKKVRRM